MPPKHKAGRQPRPKNNENERPSEREQELEAQVEALKKELSRKDGMHKDKLRAAEAALDAPSQQHYFDVLYQRDQLQTEVTELQAKLDEQAIGSTDNAKQLAKPEPSTPSTIAVSQGLPRKDRILQLTNQYTHRKEKLQAQLDEMTQAIQKIRAENDTKKRLISDVKAEERLARDRSKTQSYEQNQASQNRPFNTSSNDLSPDLLDPMAPSSAAAYPSLPGSVQAARMEGNNVAAHTAYSKVGKRSSQIFTFVNTHVENRERRRAGQSDIDTHKTSDDEGS